jgi:hypothetical protein
MAKNWQNNQGYHSIKQCSQRLFVASIFPICGKKSPDECGWWVDTFAIVEF